MRWKVTTYENKSFTDYASRIWLLDCSKSAIHWNDVIVNFFWRCFVSLVKVSYWSKFQINIITGSGDVAISFYKRLTRNLKIGNPPHGDWGKLGIPNLAQMSLTKCYWILQNVRVTAFTVFELFRDHQQMGWEDCPPPTRLGLIENWHFCKAIKNPLDLIQRRQIINLNNNNLWWEGQIFLKELNIFENNDIFEIEIIEVKNENTFVCLSDIKDHYSITLWNSITDLARSITPFNKIDYLKHYSWKKLTYRI